jgi:hypothetical protein
MLPMMSIILVATLLLLPYVSTFQIVGTRVSRSSTALQSLVKKGKLKEINTLLETLDQQPDITNFLTNGTKAFGVGKQYDFFNSTVNRFNSITIMVRLY